MSERTLADVKVGDVMVQEWHSFKSAVTVTDVSHLFIYIDRGAFFRVDTGRQAGDVPDIYRALLRFPLPGEVEAFQEEARRCELVEALDATDWDAFTREQLERLMAIVEERRE